MRIHAHGKPMSANSALFPHQKLDWLVNKLEEKVRDLPDG